MLTDEEFISLLNEAQAGNQLAKEYIVKNNFNLVRSIVHRFANRGYEWDDLFQIGCIGLVKAIDRFNINYSVKFSTYAVPMIIGEIRRFMRDDNPVKVSRPIKELAYKIHRTQEKLQGSLGREPSISEIATELSLAPQEVVSALEAIQPPTSLYDSAFHDDEDSLVLINQIKYNDGQENNFFDNLALKEVLSRLPAKERMIINLRFFQDKTQSEIAEYIGLSQVQVSRIEKNALKMIKQLLEPL